MKTKTHTHQKKESTLCESFLFLYFSEDEWTDSHFQNQPMIKGLTAQRPPPPALLPSGGCSMSPFFSQVPMGWMSEESTSLQKSLLLSLPSRRRRRRTPVRPITEAMHTEVELRGSWASSFIPTLKSLEGGSLACGWWDRNVFNQRIHLHMNPELSRSCCWGHWNSHETSNAAYLAKTARWSRCR